MALELRIRPQGGAADGKGLLAVDVDLLEFGSLDPFLRNMSLPSEGDGFGVLALIWGLPHLPWEASNLAWQPQVFFLGLAQSVHHLLQQIERPNPRTSARARSPSMPDTPGPPNMPAATQAGDPFPISMPQSQYLRSAPF